jgi:Serine dehydrogenase proteinase
MPTSFPRTKDLPSQSPLFWVTHKDRYLRQLLISDIEADTGRTLIVYFSDCDRTSAQIDQSDDVYLAELLSSCVAQPIDLLLETNGGVTDATEKICSILRSAAPDLRVIVPRRAKSNGTVIALTGRVVLMGVESELGPIDPSINGVPVDFVLNAPVGTFNSIDLQLAQTARKQTAKLAKVLLQSGMMSNSTPAVIDALIEKIATRDHYHSHGSVIDANEVKSLGLNVEIHLQDEPFWKKGWLLRTMYQYDCGVGGYSKLFESNRVSTAIAAPKK